MIQPRVPLRVSRLGHLAAAVALAAGVALLGVPAHAQEEVNEVSRLIEEGKMSQAAKQADRYLKQNPNHLQMRFLQGVIAAEQKQNSQAIKLFTALTRDYPQLPEPYNNLAVLYAAEGQERKAAEVLDQAIRTNPSYATAHENLGDLYARMASEAYSRALTLDGARQSVQPKLALITQVFPRSGAGEAKAAPSTQPVVASAAEKAEAAKLAQAKAAEAKAEAAKLAQAKAAEAKAEAAKLAQAKAAEAKAEAAKLAQAKAAEAKAEAAKLAQAKAVDAKKQAADAGAVEAAEVEDAVQAWAAAWEGQDLKRYFAAYSDEFTPNGGESIGRWREVRRVRIVGKNSINVTLRNMKVEVRGNEATARFRQNYEAGALKTTTMKTLKLKREGGHWRITREGTGS